MGAQQSPDGGQEPIFPLAPTGGLVSNKGCYSARCRQFSNRIMNDDPRLPAIRPGLGLQLIRRLPDLIETAGGNSVFAYIEFLKGSVRNPNTRAAYRRAVERFLDWCSAAKLQLRDIAPGHVADYLDALKTRRDRVASVPMTKLHLSAIRHMFDRLVVRHIVFINPAASVRGPRHEVTEGKTPALSVAQARHVLNSIPTHTEIGLRDRAIVAVLIYTAARAGAVARLRHEDFYTDGRQWWFRFEEKGGRVRQIPVRHDLEGFLSDYLRTIGPGSADAALFRSAGHGGRSSSYGLSGNDILRMIKRRFRAAGLPASRFSCHSLRAMTATDLLTQGVPMDDVQYLLGHADPRTTQLYDRRLRQVTRNIVERISV